MFIETCFLSEISTTEFHYMKLETQKSTLVLLEHTSYSINIYNNVTCCSIEKYPVA